MGDLIVGLIYLGQLHRSQLVNFANWEKIKSLSKYQIEYFQVHQYCIINKILYCKTLASFTRQNWIGPKWRSNMK